MANEEDKKWDVLTAAAGFAATLAMGVVGYEYRNLAARVDRIVNDLNAIAIVTAENRLHRENHDRTSNYWISEIEKLRANVHELQVNPTARKDPFTGTEGRDLARRIQRLERAAGGAQ